MISLLVKTEDGSLHNFECNESDTIDVLEKKLDAKPPLIFFFHAIILVKTLSFAFYHIKSGDTLHTITSGKNSSGNAGKKLFEIHKEEGEKRLNAMKLESAKLKDFLLQKIESTCIQNRKMLKRFKQQIDKIEAKVNEERSKEDTTVVPNTPSVPSAEILPCFWDYTQQSPVFA